MGICIEGGVRVRWRGEEGMRGWDWGGEDVLGLGRGKDAQRWLGGPGPLFERLVASTDATGVRRGTHRVLCRELARSSALLFLPSSHR